MTPRCTSESHEIKDVERSSGKKGVDKHVNLMMEYDFWAEDGSKVTVGPVPAEGLDSGDKATNKALSAALKYALIQTFSVPTEDMAEADLETPELGRNVNIKGSPEKDTPVVAKVATTQSEPVTVKTAPQQVLQTADVPPTSTNPLADPPKKPSFKDRVKKTTTLPTNGASSGGFG